jgi:endonuclease/exonuclease/phosphatase family metal-dependent hydrolase
MLRRSLLPLLAVGCATTATPSPSGAPEAPMLRVMTWNLEDVRTEDLRAGDHERLRRLAAVIQRLAPDVLLLSELAYDQAGAPGFDPEAGPGRNAQRFVDAYLAVSQGEGLAPLRYECFTAETNTGEPSGFDLNRDGKVWAEAPPPVPSAERPTPEGLAYGNDAWGFGTFAGQYGMAVLVRAPLRIDAAAARTFRMLPWASMPGARMPEHPDGSGPWYAGEAGARFRLSSKSHWDVPVVLPDGGVLHVLASHPTPPAFDGPERRNKLRNHDEIRLWRDYLDGADWIVDDAGRRGGLEAGAAFVVMGDLNADPRSVDAVDDPVGRFLLAHPRVQAVEPRAVVTPENTMDGVEPQHTADWKMRVDYVLPSKDFRVRRSGIERPSAGDPPTSDHFPVWLDLERAR